MFRRVWDWLSFESLMLVALVCVAAPSIDGVWQDDPGGLFRSLAALYVVLGSLGALLHPTRPALLRVLSWVLIAAGAVFFVVVSTVWFFWLPVAVGAGVQAVKAFRGEECFPLRL